MINQDKSVFIENTWEISQSMRVQIPFAKEGTIIGGFILVTNNVSLFDKDKGSKLYITDISGIEKHNFSMKITDTNQLQRCVKVITLEEGVSLMEIGRAHV